MDHTSDFVRLWTRHQAEVGRYVFMMIPRQADAAEVLQDVSVLLWKKWDQYDPERPFVPWAIRFAYLEVLKWRQKLARERKGVSNASRGMKGSMGLPPQETSMIPIGHCNSVLPGFEWQRRERPRYPWGWDLKNFM